MFDPDLNPEGFSEKFSFDMAHTGFLKNVTVQGMQLIFNEVSKGRDGKAIGGQFLTKFQPLHAWTFTPSYTLLDWSNVDAIANGADPLAVCKTAVTLGCLPQAVTTAVGSPVGVPTAAPAVTLANGVTNATIVVGTGAKATRAYLSRFTNSDLILDNVVTTPWKRFPIHVVGEYEKNLRAATNRDSMYVANAEVGQAKDKHDFIFGYAFNRTDQDAVISSFAESDERAPTNVIQHKIYGGFMVAKNTQALVTLWHGRVQDVTLPNTALLQNNPLIAFPTTGIGAFNPLAMKDPYLNRLQLDLIYKF
jgi:hypothetical protein